MKGHAAYLARRVTDPNPVPEDVAGRIKLFLKGVYEEIQQHEDEEEEGDW